MVRPTHPAVTEIGTALQRLYQAERKNAFRPDGGRSTAGDLKNLGTVLDLTLAKAIAVPALRHDRQRRVWIWKTPYRR